MKIKRALIRLVLLLLAVLLCGACGFDTAEKTTKETTAATQVQEKSEASPLRAALEGDFVPVEGGELVVTRYSAEYDVCYIDVDNEICKNSIRLPAINAATDGARQINAAVCETVNESCIEQFEDFEKNSAAYSGNSLLSFDYCSALDGDNLLLLFEINGGWVRSETYYFADCYCYDTADGTALTMEEYCESKGLTQEILYEMLLEKGSIEERDGKLCINVYDEYAQIGGIKYVFPLDDGKFLVGIITQDGTFQWNEEI